MIIPDVIEIKKKHFTGSEPTFKLKSDGKKFGTI